MGFDIEGGELQAQGRLLPDNLYVVEIEEVTVDEDTDAGTARVLRRYGSLRLPDGAVEFQLPDGTMFRIGERKAFSRSWWNHPSEQATAIGHRELAKEAIALGLMEKPKKGETATFPFGTPQEYADAIRGRQLQIRTKQKPRTRKDASGVKVPVLDEESGEQVRDVIVVDWRAI